MTVHRLGQGGIHNWTKQFFLNRVFWSSNRLWKRRHSFLFNEFFWESNRLWSDAINFLSNFFVRHWSHPTVQKNNVLFCPESLFLEPKQKKITKTVKNSKFLVFWLPDFLQVLKCTKLIFQVLMSSGAISKHLMKSFVFVLSLVFFLCAI